LVRSRSLALMAGGMNHFLRLSGMALYFAVFTPDNSVERVEHALLGVIEGAVERGISDRELQKVRNAALTGRIFEMYSAEHLCQRLGFSETVEGDYRLWVKRIETLERLDREHLVAVAGAYLAPARRRCLYLRPKRVRPMLVLGGMLRRLVPGK
jgi:predicted Zn-dependent peptidase